MNHKKLGIILALTQVISLPAFAKDKDVPFDMPKNHCRNVDSEISKIFESVSTRLRSAEANVVAKKFAVEQSSSDRNWTIARTATATALPSLAVAIASAPVGAGIGLFAGPSAAGHTAGLAQGFANIAMGGIAGFTIGGSGTAALISAPSLVSGYLASDRLDQPSKGILQLKKDLDSSYQSFDEAHNKLVDAKDREQQKMEKGASSFLWGNGLSLGWKTVAYGMVEVKAAKESLKLYQQEAKFSREVLESLNETCELKASHAARSVDLTHNEMPAHRTPQIFEDVSKIYEKNRSRVEAGSAR